MRVLDDGFVYLWCMYIGAYNECDTGELAELEA